MYRFELDILLNFIVPDNIHHSQIVTFIFVCKIEVISDFLVIEGIQQYLYLQVAGTQVVILDLKIWESLILN